MTGGSVVNFLQKIFWHLVRMLFRTTMTEQQARHLMFTELLEYLQIRHGCCTGNEKTAELVNMSTASMAIKYKQVYPDKECPTWIQQT